MQQPHPIDAIMSVTMENIKDMVDVNTVVGEPIVCPDGATIIPVSRVSFGFLAGGGESNAHRPFTGGSGAGVTVSPVGFLCVRGDSIRMLPAQYGDAAERAMELIPQAIDALKSMRK